MKLQNLARKFQRVWREEGWKAAVGRVAHFAGNKEGRKERRIDSKKAKREKGTVLFINGCWAKTPIRYRVLHQMEQLREAGISCNKVYFEDLELEMEENYKVFVIYRSEYIDILGEFIKLAKQHHKKIFFDIDDLIFDTSYTDQVPFVKEMPPETKAVFDGVTKRIQKTVRTCESAITTTETLADELKKYMPEVLINRNVASKEMVACSEKAYQEKRRQAEGRVLLGYFSGSLTHNQDFEIVRPAVMRIMEEYDWVDLLLVGELEASDQLRKFGNRIIQNGMVDWRKLPEMIVRADINLAPLEDTLFNRAKSEIKWIEAALVRVPTVARKMGAFETMIDDGATGLLADNTNGAWYSALKELIEDKEYRERVGKQAYQYVIQNCTTAAKAEYYGNIIEAAARLADG